MTFIVTRDRAAARAFYGQKLGCAFVSEDPFAMVFDLNGTMLRITQMENHAAQPHTVLGWEVPDIASAVEELREQGVVFTIYDGLGQDDLGIWSAPGGAQIAWFQDTDGNVLSLAQF